MQKKIIALAVAGLVSGAAFAQSNVTIYGVADLTFDNVKAGGATDSGYNMPNRNRVSSNSSYIGFKGAEDLGNGLKAVFQFESGVNPDATGGTWANRDSYVGLGGGFGTVAMGNLTGPTRALGAAMDPFAGATGITANTGLIGKLGGGAGASLFDTRWQNAIAYISPSFSGFSVVAAYVANENKTRDGLSGTAGQLNTRGYDIGAKYENGPIMVAASYNQAKVGDIADTKGSATRVGAKYNFGMGTVGLLWDRVKWEDNTGNAKRNAWFLPVTFNVGGNGKIIAQYGHAGDVTDTSDTGAKMFAIGYEHSLSKRTMIKAVWSQISNEAAASYDFGVNAVGFSQTNGAGADPKGFQIGIRHTF
ncbi:porin [Sulfuricystis thermophila]|uniref:porin n=1 Tax=Sulfuricystis thermophila TaxID=2496847 RepID=UPI0015590C05|nr:porin [Sulfuricystis thermophila]